MTSKSGKKSRMQIVRNNPPKQKGDPKDNGNDADTPERVEATEEDFLAVQLHQSRDQKNQLRRVLSAKEKELVDLRTQLGVANQTILQLQIDIDEMANNKLREERSFQVNKTITKDDEGNVFWEPIQQPQG